MKEKIHKKSVNFLRNLHFFCEFVQPVFHFVRYIEGIKSVEESPPAEPADFPQRNWSCLGVINENIRTF